MNMGAVIVVLAICLVIDGISLAAVISMLVSLGKHGDERRVMIVQRACASTLIVGLIYLMAVSLFQIICALVLNEEPGGISPLNTLAILAVVYHIQVFRYKRKYGN